MKTLIIAFDSLKFYKLKNENTARLLFIILYVLTLLSYVLPFGEPFSIEFLMDSLQNNPADIINSFGSSQIIYYFSLFAVSLISSFLALIYANCMIMESENFPNKKAVKTSFIKLPHIILYLILTVPVIFISSILAFIPLIYLYYAMYFVPLFITEGRKNVFESIIESFKYTRGFKFSIFFTQLTIYFIMNIPISLINATFLSTGYDNTVAEFLVLSFLRAAYILMTGRMMGNFYILIVKNRDKIKKLKLNLVPPKENYDTREDYIPEDEEDEDEEEDIYGREEDGYTDNDEEEAGNESKAEKPGKSNS